MNYCKVTQIMDDGCIIFEQYNEISYIRENFRLLKIMDNETRKLVELKNKRKEEKKKRRNNRNIEQIKIDNKKRTFSKSTKERFRVKKEKEKKQIEKQIEKEKKEIEKERADFKRDRAIFGYRRRYDR
jgi:hypothetical protein